MHNVIKVFFLSLLISITTFSQNNPSIFVQTKVDSSWEDNVIIFPDSIYLSNYNVTDSCYIINDSKQIVHLDSIYNKSYSSYGCKIKNINESEYYYFRVNPYEKRDTVHVKLNPKDTIIFIIEDVDVCPICKKQFNGYLIDTLVFLFSSDSNRIEKIVPLNSNIPSDVGDDNTNINSFYLSQNFPNPFNPSTKIRFSIPHSAFVTLKVYDLLGREIATIINEEKMPGNYEVSFNANNLSSGVYFYRIRAGSFIDTKRLILLR